MSTWARTSSGPSWDTNFSSAGLATAIIGPEPKSLRGIGNGKSANRETRAGVGGGPRAYFGAPEERAKFVIVALLMILLGMLTMWPSALNTRVLRRPMDSTTPS